MIRHCDHCGQDSDGSDDWGGPDPCLGHLDGVIGACCGHGRGQGDWLEYAPYLWLSDGRKFAVAEAVAMMRELGGNPPTTPQPSEPRCVGTLSAVSIGRA